MTERIHYDGAVVDLPLPLNPIILTTLLSNRRVAAQGRFVTNILVRYHPDVSTETAGTVAFAVSRLSSTNLQAISACVPSYTGPVWKPAQLNIPHSLVNVQEWLTENTPTLFLVADGARGNFTITCTIKLLISLADKAYTAYDPYEQLSYLTTQCYVGPVLEGFSLVSCMAIDLNKWRGTGMVINVDMTNAGGRTTNSRQGLRTPRDKCYIAVLFGCGSIYDWKYYGDNNAYSWHTNTDVMWSYDNTSPPTGQVSVSQLGSWRPVVGSTQEWAWIDTDTVYTTVNGNAMTFYYPCSYVVLYYYYAGVNIFDPTFRPMLLAHPGSKVPLPPGLARPNTRQYIPLFMTKMQALWSPYWKPVRDIQQNAQLEQAKASLECWPVTSL